MNNKKYKLYTEFKDNVHNITFGVILLNKKEAEKFAKSENMLVFDGCFDGATNNFLFHKTDANTVAHEAWHGLEYTLLQKRSYSINTEEFNEPLAYYLGFLVGNIHTCLKSLTNK